MILLTSVFFAQLPLVSAPLIRGLFLCVASRGAEHKEDLLAILLYVIHGNVIPMLEN